LSLGRWLRLPSPSLSTNDDAPRACHERSRTISRTWGPGGRRPQSEMWKTRGQTDRTYPVAQTPTNRSQAPHVQASARTQRMTRDRQWDCGPCRSHRPVPARVSRVRKGTCDHTTRKYENRQGCPLAPSTAPDNFHKHCAILPCYPQANYETMCIAPLARQRSSTQILSPLFYGF
jgi:hypothetical protein